MTTTTPASQLRSAARQLYSTLAGTPDFDAALAHFNQLVDSHGFSRDAVEHAHYHGFYAAGNFTRIPLNA